MQADKLLEAYGIIEQPEPNKIVPLKQITGIKFTFLTSQEIRDMAVVELKQSKMIGENSVYDPLMGANKGNEKCKICSMLWANCPGHPGFIPLPYPIPHPIRLTHLADRITCFCAFCHRIIITKHQMRILELLKYKGEHRYNAFLVIAKKIVRCPYKSCKKPHGRCIVKDDKFYRQFKRRSQVEKIPVTYEEVYEIVTNIRQIESALLGFPDPLCHPMNMIIENLYVLPPSSRPYVESGSSGPMHDDLTHKYIDILKKVNSLKSTTNEKQKNDNIDQLFFHIKTLMDNSRRQPRCRGKTIYEKYKATLFGEGGASERKFNGQTCWAICEICN